MTLPRLDYQHPDYLGQIGQGIDAAAQVARDNSPAPDFVQRFAKHGMSNKMSPEEAAAWAKLVHAGHVDDPTQPQGQQLTGGNVTFSGPQPGAPMGRVNAPQAPMPASQPPSGGGFTGRQEYTGPEETVTAPSQPADLSALSQEPDEPQSNAPILNKDVPMLMQVAGQQQKRNPMDTYMKLYALGLRGQELQEKYREFEGMQPVRQSMINQRDAGITNMPVKNQQAEGRLDVSKFNAQTSRGNLDTRRTENFLKGTAETAQAIPQLTSVLNDLKMSPGVAPPDWDYATRKMGRIMGGLPFVGNSLKEGFEIVADTALTPEQRQIRARIAQAVQPYRKLAVGTQITPGEFALIDQISGQGLGVGDQIAALMALKASMEARQGRVEAGYPEMPGRIPMARPEQVMPPIQNPYSTGFGGPENIGQPQGEAEPPPAGMTNPDPGASDSFGPQRQLRGKVSSSFGGP